MMSKETMINIINQHGLDVLYDVISDIASNEYYKGYECGLHDGWDDCYDTFVAED